MKDKLTGKQQAFVDNYCSNGFNATRAAIDAGYSERTAYRTGADNLKKPHIAEAIDKFKSKTAERCEKTVDSLVDDLDEIRDVALKCKVPQTAAAVAAIKTQAQLLGLDIHRVDHSSRDGTMSPKIAEMTDEEFAEKLKLLGVHEHD